MLSGARKKAIPSNATYNNENKNVHPKMKTKKSVCKHSSRAKKKLDAESCNRQNQVIIKKGSVEEEYQWNGKRKRPTKRAKKKKRAQDWRKKLLKR